MVKTLENNKRSIVKSISYRIYQSFIISPVIVYILTSNIILSFKFGLLEFVIKIPSYYLFERLWALIKFGYNDDNHDIAGVNYE